MEYTKYAQECTEFLQRLIRTSSVNGMQNEVAVVRVIAEEAEKLGLPYEVIAKDSTRPNIFVGENFEGNDSLLLVAHTDTVPEGDPDKWTEQPYEAIIKDGRLYGRGAVDCKGGIALGIYTLKILADRGGLGKAKFVGVADEESGASSSLGLACLLEKGLRAKEAVYMYGSDEKYASLTIGHRGLIRLWVTCHGESVHTGFKDWQNGDKGCNAIVGIADFIEAVKSFALPGKSDYFPGYGLKLTPTLLEGGTAESIVPDKARVLLDIRTLPVHKCDEIIEQITKLAEDLATEKSHFEIEVKNNIPGAITDSKSSLVQKALRLNEDVFGVKSELSGAGAAFEGYMLINHGIPTISAYGPCGGGAHSPNEYCEIDTIEPTLRLLSRIALEQ